MQNIINEIEEDILDIQSKNFVFANTYDVPSRHDTAFTFERGEDKRGKQICTCVLFVDIRNSVQLTKTHSSETMGRIYTIFSKSMLKLAKHHNGAVRNIIGDRVMIVFPSENCFLNAVYCAVSINHVAKSINTSFSDVNFSCGIGIDHGQLKVIKVGLRRHGEENFDNKNLVWTGYPANLASRLTDVANKVVFTPSVQVKYNPCRLTIIKGEKTVLKYINEEPYSSTVRVKTQTHEEFTKNIYIKDGLLKYSWGKVIEKKEISTYIKYKPILITDSVYNGLKINHPEKTEIINIFTEKNNHKIKDITNSIYESSATWKLE